jgi:hypothetical protein
MFIIYDGAIDTTGLKIHTGLECEIHLLIVRTIFFLIYFSYFVKNLHTSCPFSFIFLERTLPFIIHCNGNNFHMKEYYKTLL